MSGDLQGHAQDASSNLSSDPKTSKTRGIEKAFGTPKVNISLDCNLCLGHLVQCWYLLSPCQPFTKFHQAFKYSLDLLCGFKYSSFSPEHAMMIPDFYRFFRGSATRFLQSAAGTLIDSSFRWRGWAGYLCLLQEMQLMRVNADLQFLNATGASDSRGVSGNANPLPQNKGYKGWSWVLPEHLMLRIPTLSSAYRPFTDWGCLRTGFPYEVL